MNYMNKVTYPTMLNICTKFARLVRIQIENYTMFLYTLKSSMKEGFFKGLNCLNEVDPSEYLNRSISGSSALITKNIGRVKKCPEKWTKKQKK